MKLILIGKINNMKLTFPKSVFRSVKVEYNGHLERYEVYYRNWLFWCYDSCYKFDKPGSGYVTHYCNQEQAQERAIKRAEGMLNTTIIFEQSNVSYY